VGRDVVVEAEAVVAVVAPLDRTETLKTLRPVFRLPVVPCEFAGVIDVPAADRPRRKGRRIRARLGDLPVVVLRLGQMLLKVALNFASRPANAVASTGTRAAAP
jgi:hypothetical protein